MQIGELNVKKPHLSQKHHWVRLLWHRRHPGHLSCNGWRQSSLLSMVWRKTVLLVARRRRRMSLGHVPWPGTQAPQLEDREQQVALAVVHSRVVQLVEEVVHL